MICGATARCLDDAVKPLVEHGDNLGQARDDGDFADAREQLAEREAEAALAALRLAVGGNGANPRSFPNRRAFNELALAEQERKDIAQHVWACRRQQSQRSTILFRIGVDGHEIQRVCVVERIPFIPVLDRDLPTQSP